MTAIRVIVQWIVITAGFFATLLLLTQEEIHPAAVTTVIHGMLVKMREIVVLTMTAIRVIVQWIVITAGFFATLLLLTQEEIHPAAVNRSMTTTQIHQAIVYMVTILSILVF